MARIKGIIRLGIKKKRNTNNIVGDSTTKPKDKMKNNKNSTSTTTNSSSDSAEIVVPSGFIFLCNNKTKARCFQYQVFGLSISQKRTVEKIKPGTKLFLFDYEMRLLHGVFEAVSHGKLDLEPLAFHGKYLAQVKFRIIKDCFPLEEKFFKSAILDNYRSGRLRLELSEQQVNELVPLFHVFRVPAAPDQQPLTRVSNSESSLVMMPRTREMINDHHQQYDDDDHDHHSIVTKNLNFMSRWLHCDHDSLQILQQNQYSMAAIVDHHHHHHHHSIPNLIHHVEEPFHPRQITGQQQEYWFPQNQNQITTMGMANDHQLPIMQPRQYFPHPQETEPSFSSTTWYHHHHHHHQLPFIGENNQIINPNYSNLSTAQYDHHQIPYLVTGPALQPLIHHHLPITTTTTTAAAAFAHPDHSTYSMNIPSSSTTLVWPHQQNYSCPLPPIFPSYTNNNNNNGSYASPISLRRWLEPNINVNNIPQISTAEAAAAHHHFITMQSSHAAASFNYSFV